MAAPYFISEAQFIGEIELNFGDYSKFDDFTTQKEKEILIDLLGWELYYALISDLDGSGDPQTQKYIDLVDGVAAGYQDNSSNYRELAGIKTMAAYFFYYYYVKDVQSHNTEVGDVVIQSTNAVEAIHSKNERMLNAWEIGRGHYYNLVDFINLKNSTQGSDYYDNFSYKDKESANVWGI